MDIWSAIKEITIAEFNRAKVLRKVRIQFDPDRCKGVWQCYEVCPIGCWVPDFETRVVVHVNTEACIACGACVLQCPEDAIQLI